MRLQVNTTTVVHPGGPNPASPSPATWPLWTITLWLLFATLMFGIPIWGMWGKPGSVRKYFNLISLRLLRRLDERYKNKARARTWPGYYHHRSNRNPDPEIGIGMGVGIPLHDLKPNGRRYRNRISIDSEDGLEILGHGRATCEESSGQEDQEHRVEGMMVAESSAMGARRKTWVGEQGAQLSGFSPI